MGDRGIPKELAAHERLQQPHLQLDQPPPDGIFWVKYHFISDQGIDYLTQEDADRLAGRGWRLPPNATCTRRSRAVTSQAGH